MLLVLFLLVAAMPGAELPQWRETTVTDSLKMGYQLVAADLNRDGRPDLIVVDERGTELAWFENPTWERHVLIKDVPRTINLDVYDYDGDGIPEIAMGHNFETVPEKSIGNVLILKSGRDALDGAGDRPRPRRPPSSLDQLAGDDRKVLLVAPMIGRKARRRTTRTMCRSTFTVRANGNANCSRTSLAAFSTASRRSAGRGPASNS
jgi:hypothetical protein